MSINFKLAADPQIVKYYAAGDVGTSKRLTLNTAKFSFFLMLFLCLPIYVVADPLLKLWLVIVPILYFDFSEADYFAEFV